MKIIAIVEGDGEVEAVPVLIRRIGSLLSPLDPPHVLRSIRVRRHRVLREGELERYVLALFASVIPSARLEILG